MLHNVTKLNLLRNKDFYFVNENNKKIFFKVPTLEDFIVDNQLQTFLSTINIKWQSLELNTKINNVTELLVFMIQNKFQDDILTSVLHKYIDNLTIRNTGFLIDGEYITDEQFMFITQC
jgi:hypothetical protein